MRQFGYAAESPRQDIADVQMLRLQSMCTADLLTSAFELALKYDITACDACYAALAKAYPYHS